jgi:hypothetical protein
MRKSVFAAGFLLTTLQWSHAQDFNPGTVVGNVFQNPLSGCGYGYGLGCYPPGYGPPPDRASLVRHHQIRRRIRHDMAVQH